MEEKYIAGYEVGALVMKSWVPKPPGHISNASNYDFPVYYQVVEDTSNQTVHSGSEKIIPNIIENARVLKELGCRSLVTSCGYFGHYQKKVADTGIMPTYLSAVMLIPLILHLVPKDRTIALICYNKEKLTMDLFEACGVRQEQRKRVFVYDVINEPELGKIIRDCGTYNISKAREEVVSVALKAQKEHGDVGAILLECTDLPPHAAAIQAATNLPVFDATSMVKFVQTLPE